MKRICLVLLSVALTGCGAWRPIIDPVAGSSANYEMDLAQCRQLASANNSTAANAAVSAAVGAGLMAAFSAILGGGHTSRWAGAGAVAGGAQGAGAGVQEQRVIIRNCMIGRGYRVLN